MTPPPVLPTSVTADPQVADAQIAVLPIGSFEQHGPHLPLVTDTLVAVAIANAIAEQQPGVLTLPPVTLSCSHEHMGFPGSIAISSATLAAIIGDVIESLHHQGIHRLLVVNGHGGNYVLGHVAQEANLRGHAQVAVFPAREDWAEARDAAAMTSDQHDDMHAGELETSILLAAFPEYLRDGWENDDHTHDDRRHLPTLSMTAYTLSGVIGRPSLATADKGRTVLDHLGKQAEVTARVLGDKPST